MGVCEKRYKCRRCRVGTRLLIYALISIFYNKEIVTSVDYALLVLVLIWSLRLGIYLFFRNRKKGEDARYQDLKKNWGESPFIQAYFKVFLLQSALMYITGLPILFITQANIDLSNIHYIFIIISLIAIIYEGVADYQKNEFKKEFGFTPTGIDIS